MSLKKNAPASPDTIEDEHCPLIEFVRLISGKWSIPILYNLIVADGPVRFGELQRATAPITQKELTRHLRHFEDQGLVRRTVFPEMPPRVEYEITAIGATLKPPLDAVATWMVTHGEELTGPKRWRSAPPPRQSRHQGDAQR
jgi:DNA-binding HxlR family transcriptional regulator